MTFRAEFDGAALVQLNGLPSAAFDALVARVVALVQEPWDADLMAPGDDPAYREVIFGGGNGLLSFQVDNAAELIRIFDIAQIDLRATATAGLAVLVTLIVAWLVEIAGGRSGHPYDWLVAISGIAYLLSVAFFRWRG